MRHQIFFFAALTATCFEGGPETVALNPKTAVVRFEKGDQVAFAGDSITSGGTYHKYIFTYWATRYPELRVRFRRGAR